MGLDVSESDLAKGAIPTPVSASISFEPETDYDQNELSPENDPALNTLIIDDLLKNKEDSPFFKGLEEFTAAAFRWIEKGTDAAKNAADKAIDTVVPKEACAVLKAGVEHMASTAKRFERDIGKITLNGEHSTAQLSRDVTIQHAEDIFIALESGGKNIQAIQNGLRASHAAGILQFEPQTWLGYVKQHGAKYGMSDWAEHISGRPGHWSVDPAYKETILNGRFDMVKSLAMEGELIADADAALKARGLETSVRNRYAYHFAGTLGVRVLEADPSKSVESVLGREAAQSNASMFYRNGRSITVGEFIGAIDSRIITAQVHLQKNGSYVAAITGQPTPPVQFATAHPAVQTAHA